MSSAAVARVVGASSRTVGYRIARLTRMGVIKVGAVVDPRSLGLEVIADVFMEVVPGRVREVAERFARLEEVSYVAGSIGNGDLSIQVYLRNGAALTRFIDEVVGQTPGVTRARTVLVPWKLKDVYQWNVPAIADPGDG
jgi:Lrp/AsnC family transcriptional regulator for asnA, asnC and gidA